jgi:hypothetical protein
MKHGIFIVSVCAISGAAILGCSAATGPDLAKQDGASGADVPDADAGKMNPIPAYATPIVQLVHAATGLGDVRICFLPDANPAEPSDVNIPQTNYAGLPVGGSVFFRNASKYGGMTLAKPFAVTAAGLGGAEYGRTPYSCSELANNAVFVKIPIQPPSQPLDASGPSLLALVGCPAGVGDVKRCGPTFDMTNGNLHFVTVNVANTIPADRIGAFVTNLSPSVQSEVNGKMVASRVGTLASPCNAVNMELTKSTLDVGAIAPAAQSLAAPTLFDAEGFAACLDANTAIVARSYAQLQEATAPTSLPAEHFQTRSNYVFTILGDTTASSGPEAVHALAIRFEATN